MHDAQVPGFSLRSLDPFVFGKIRRHFVVLVVNDSVSRNLERFVVHIEDFVGLRNGPAVGERRWLGQVRRITFGLTVFDPQTNQFFLFWTQPAIIGKVTMLRIGMPRWHPTFIDHFPNHFAPTIDLVIAGHREWPDLSVAVTFNAAFVEQP